MGMLTLKIKLEPTAEIMKAIDTTLAAYQASYNRVIEYQYPNLLSHINGVEIHHATYTSEKAYGLPTALICSARVRATETLKSAQAALKKRLKKNKDATVKQPTARFPLPMRYNNTCMVVQLTDGWVSFATVEGRKKLNFKLPKCYEDKVILAVKSTELWKDRKHSKYFLSVVVEYEDPKFEFNSNVVGIDLGIKKPAVTSLNKFLGRGHWNTVGKRYFEVRRSLQSKGTKSARRRLRLISGKENRFRKDCDHVLSRRIVDSVSSGTVLVLEDLTAIRSQKYSREFNRNLHTWSFYRLRTFIEYKSRKKGCLVELVNPKYTSQECSCCHHISRGNRKTQSRFKCKKCGFEINADLNAARNIASRYSEPISLGIPLTDGVQSITPYVASNLAASLGL
jgi:IS605 OrfB family transposase